MRGKKKRKKRSGQRHCKRILWVLVLVFAAVAVLKASVSTVLGGEKGREMRDFDFLFLFPFLFSFLRRRTTDDLD